MMDTKERPRGGIIVSVTAVGARGQYRELWCIDPVTHEERVITVWAEDDRVPVPGDECWWRCGHSPGWRRMGEEGRTAFLPRVGNSYDPTQR